MTIDRRCKGSVKSWRRPDRLASPRITRASSRSTFSAGRRKKGEDMPTPSPTTGGANSSARIDGEKATERCTQTGNGHNVYVMPIVHVTLPENAVNAGFWAVLVGCGGSRRGRSSDGRAHRRRRTRRETPALTLSLARCTHMCGADAFDRHDMTRTRSARLPQGPSVHRVTPRRRRKGLQTFRVIDARRPRAFTSFLHDEEGSASIRRGGSMEVFLEWLLFELAAVALQVAILRIINWVRGRSLSSGGSHHNGGGRLSRVRRRRPRAA